jgi:glycosyltransferase involved in cell wall biosynthesis
MERQVKRAGLNPNIQSAIVRNPISSEYLNLKIGETDKNLISSFTVTFVSHDLQNPYKGLDNVLNCIAIYSQEMNRQEIQFQFVGNGSKLDIKGIEFRQYPNLDELDLIDIYKSTDLLLVPSKTDNSPTVVFEAAMCGTPFLGSNRAGLPELSEIFGLRTFEFGNPESLYNAIVDLKHSEIDRANIRSLALQIVDPQKIAKTMKSLYQRKLTDAVSRRSGKDF